MSKSDRCVDAGQSVRGVYVIGQVVGCRKRTVGEEKRELMTWRINVGDDVLNVDDFDGLFPNNLGEECRIRIRARAFQNRAGIVMVGYALNPVPF